MGVVRKTHHVVPPVPTYLVLRSHKTFPICYPNSVPVKYVLKHCIAWHLEHERYHRACVKYAPKQFDHSKTKEHFEHFLTKTPRTPLELKM